MDFGWILGGFWVDFWKDLSLQTMIRATKGKSMDGWMHGCMDAWMHGCMDGRAEGWIS